MVETGRLESHIPLISPVIAKNSVGATDFAPSCPFLRIIFKFSFLEHKANARHGLPEIVNKTLPLLPRGAMPDHDDSNRSIREIKIPCSVRTHDRNHRVPERFENLLANRH